MTMLNQKRKGGYLPGSKQNPEVLDLFNKLRKIGDLY